MLIESGLPRNQKLLFPPGIVSMDAEEIVRRLSQQLMPHEMRVIRGGVNSDIRWVEMGPLSIGYIEYGAAVEISPTRLGNFFLIHASLSGCTTVTTGSGTKALSVNNLVITGPGQEVVYSMAKDCSHLTVKIDANLFYQSTAKSADIYFPRDMSSIEDNEIIQAWSLLVLQLVQQYSVLNALPRRESIFHHYAVGLIDILLSALPDMECEAAATMPWYVRRAREMMQADAGDIISVAHLAGAVGVSARGLQAGFRKHYGVGPAEYARQCRLERLHTALLNADGSRNVTDVMLDCGISSLGRFAHYYQKKYHCHPSETLRRSAPVSLKRLTGVGQI